MAKTGWINGVFIAPVTNIGRVSNLTSNGLVKVSGSDGTLGVDAVAYAPIDSPNFTTDIYTPLALVGADANFTDFANAKIVVSQADSGVTDASRIGIVGEATASNGTTGIGIKGVAGIGVASGFNTAIGGDFKSTGTNALGRNIGVNASASGCSYNNYGNIGVVSYATTSSAGDAWGIYSTASVSNTSDSGTAMAGFFTSTAAHAAGANTGIYAIATGGLMNTGGSFTGATNGTHAGYGISAICGVGATEDTGRAYAGFFNCSSTHAGGINYGVFGEAANGSINIGGAFSATTHGGNLTAALTASCSVNATADTAVAYAGEFYSTDTHAGADNVAVYAEASAGALNYSFYGAAGVMKNIGAIELPYVAKTATYVITAADYTINCTANTFTVTLPTAVGCAGRIYNIKNSGTGVITVDANGTETIDGELTQTLNQYDNMQIQSTNTNWIIL